MKRFILILFILAVSIFPYASDAIKKASCENGDAIDCYEFGHDIELARSNCVGELMDEKKVSSFKRMIQLCKKRHPGKVKDWYTKACQYGYAYGCKRIDKKFDKKKVPLLQNECNKKDAESCSKLGLFYFIKSLSVYLGDMIMVKDYKILKKAEEYYKKSCDYGSGKGCYFLAEVIHIARHDKDDEISAYKRAAKLGYGQAYSKMAELSKGNSTKVDYYHRKACENSAVKGCIHLAVSFKSDDNYGVVDDLADPVARKYRVKACELGYALSCDALGRIYDNGLGVKQDYFKAVHYYKQACESNIVDSCTNLGIKYYNGQGVRQDYSKAEHYFEIACSQNELNACNNLGIMYRSGAGIIQDYFKAKNFFEKACPLPQKTTSGISLLLNPPPSLGAACLNLGTAYLQGLGTRQDLKKAKEYFGKACDSGLQEGCSAYAKLNSLEN